MNLQKSFRQALPKLFSYKFTWVKRNKLAGYYEYNYQYPRKILAVTQVAHARQA